MGMLGKRPIITPILAYLLCAGLCLGAYMSRDNSFRSLSLGLYLLLPILGLACAPYLFKPIAFTQHDAWPRLAPYSNGQRWFSLILSQLLVLIGGGLLCFGAILQSQISPKAASLSFEALVPLIKDNSFRCLFLPWLTISVLSVLAAQQAKTSASLLWLPSLTLGPAQQHPKKFCLSAYNVILHTGITTAGILLICIAIGLLCESLAHTGLMSSAWQTPIRNCLLMFIILIFTYRYRNRLLKKYVRRRFSLGAIFCIQACLILATLLGFELLLNFGEFPIQEHSLFQTPIAPMTLEASIDSIGTSLMLWPLLLIPYLVPLFARIHLGLRSWQALLMPLCLPALLFLWLLPQKLQASDLMHSLQILQTPQSLFWLGLLSLLIVYCLFQHVRSFFDLHVGSLPLINPPHKNPSLYPLSRPLVKGILSWMALIFFGSWFIIHFTLYSIGLFLLLCLGATGVRCLFFSLRKA